METWPWVACDEYCASILVIVACLFLVDTNSQFSEPTIDWYFLVIMDFPLPEYECFRILSTGRLDLYGVFGDITAASLLRSWSKTRLSMNASCWSKWIHLISTDMISKVHNFEPRINQCNECKVSNAKEGKGQPQKWNRIIKDHVVYNCVSYTCSTVVLPITNTNRKL